MITVVIPLYNKRSSIACALDSVLNQSVLPIEIIVVDDGSTDGSAEIVNGFKHPLIRLIQQLNSGVSAARNKGIEEAKGDWIAFLDADDEWLPEYLETMHSLSQTYPQCQVVASAYMLQDHRGTQKPIILRKIPFQGEHGMLNNYFEVASCSHPPICSISVTVKKTALQEIGGFPVGIKVGEDLITWARLAVNFDISYSTKKLSIFKQDVAHTYDNKPNRTPDQPDYVAGELIRLYNENKTATGLKLYIAHWYKMRGSIFLRLGMTQQAIKETLRSIKLNPVNLKIYFYLLIAFLPLWSRNKIFKKLGI